MGIFSYRMHIYYVTLRQKVGAYGWHGTGMGNWIKDAGYELAFRSVTSISGCPVSLIY